MLKRYAVLGCAGLCVFLAACSPKEQQEINQKADQAAQATSALVKTVASATADTVVAGAKNLKNLANYSSVMIPANVEQYRQAMTNFAQNGGQDPFYNLPFVVKTVPENIAHNIEAKTQFAIDQVIDPAHLAAGKITQFSIQNHIAYVQLEMDTNGWAGVSSTIAMIHPLVTKNLLAYPTIHHVVWSAA